MASAEPDLTAALAELPLFPLQEAVLLPGMALPLHVFEPRYRQMVRDALGSHRALAVVCVPDPEADMTGSPPICAVAGAGVIVAHRELPDGRFHVALAGRERVRLDELPFHPPYRRARATVLATVAAEVASSEIAALHAAVTAFVRSVRAVSPAFDPELPAASDIGAFCDTCAGRLLLTGAARQQVLEALDVRERVRVLTEALALQAHLAPDRQSYN